MTNEEQSQIWNNNVGEAWVTHASLYDEMLGPTGQVAMDRLAVQPGDRVLDLGCGTGATTIELARRSHPGEAVGVDLSATMLGAARARAEAAGELSATFRVADVQTADLGHRTFDKAYSRMGVMFFADPVAAFSNVAAALRPAGGLTFACFQAAAANPSILLPVIAAAPSLRLSPPDPTAPGPFSLADPADTARLLEAAGFGDVEVEPGPDHMLFSGGDDLVSLARSLLMQNPYSNPAFTAADQATQRAAIDAVATALAPHREGNKLRVGAATWIVSATTPAETPM